MVFHPRTNLFPPALSFTSSAMFHYSAILELLASMIIWKFSINCTEEMELMKHNILVQLFPLFVFIKHYVQIFFSFFNKKYSCSVIESKRYERVGEKEEER